MERNPRNEGSDPEAQFRFELLNLLDYLSDQINLADLDESQLTKARSLVKQFLTPLNDDVTRQRMIKIHNSLYQIPPK